MMKKLMMKFLSAMLCATMVVSFAACGDTSKPDDKTSAPAPSDKPSPSGKPEVSVPNMGFEPGVDVKAPLKTDKMPYLTKPKATGDFIQAWLCDGWPASRWESHMAILKQAGYEFVILQNTVSITNGKISRVGFKNDFIDDKSICADQVAVQDAFLGTVLDAARKMGMKVMIGIGCDDDWWKCQYTDEWCAQQIKVNNAVAQQIYDHYYKDYKDVINGWYWTYEMWTQNSLHESAWAGLFNPTRKYIHDLTPELPMMVGPFISQYEHITPDQSREEWERFFEAARFYDGDIFCPQDSFGSQGEPLEYIEAHQLAMKEATKKANAKVNFWLDVENFEKSGKSAAVERFTKQLDISSRIATGLVSFSYSHYYDPAQKPGRFHKAYVKYLDTIKDLKID